MHLCLFSIAMRVVRVGTNCRSFLFLVLWGYVTLAVDLEREYALLSVHVCTVSLSPFLLVLFACKTT